MLFTISDHLMVDWEMGKKIINYIFHNPRERKRVRGERLREGFNTADYLVLMPMGCNFLVLPASELNIMKTYLTSSVKAASGPDLLICKSSFPPCFRKSLSFCCLENKRREKKKKKAHKLVRQLAVL